MSQVPHPRYQGADWTIYEAANTSISKAKYSFPKSDRFRGSIKASLNEKVSYDLPSTLIGRATSFGFGTRSKNEAIKRRKFEQQHNFSFLESPSPDTYNLNIGFEGIQHQQ